jgi:DNA-binding GntR family transcriptional regulator
VISLLARWVLRLAQRMGVRNLYVRRALWLLAALRWIVRRRKRTTQVIRLRDDEQLLISVNNKENHLL